MSRTKRWKVEAIIKEEIRQEDELETIAGEEEL